MKNFIFLLIFVILLLTSCSVEKTNQGAVSHSDYGFIRLNGSMVNREALIDGNSVGIDPEADSNTYRLAAGMHNLEIRSKNRILFSEGYLITAGQTVDVTVP